MDSSKLSALLLVILFFSSAPQILACDTCPPTKPKPPKGPIVLPPIIGKPPITVPRLPPIIGKPPITVPPVIGKPPVILPPIIGKPPITLPPVIGKPPITLPPVVTPILPPVIGRPPIPPPIIKPGCPPPPATATCPIDTLKLGACGDLLGAAVHIGDPAVNECCPVIGGLVDLEAALCLCTTIKLKLLNIKASLPIALQLLVTCGKTPPPGFTCPA